MPLLSFSELKRLATEIISTMHNSRKNDLISWYVYQVKIAKIDTVRITNKFLVRKDS